MSVSLENKIQDRRGERGALLVTIAAVAVIAGVVLSLGIGALKTEDNIDRNFETLTKMELVVDQLAAYVHRNRRVPCPADPGETVGTWEFGLEMTDNAPTLDADNSCDEIVGIVPFRSLNISAEEVQDAWGGYFTYAISPVFADLPTSNTAGAYGGDSNIFFRCRTEEWADDEQVAAVTDFVDCDDIGTSPPSVACTNENRMKARFCCSALNVHNASTDLVVRVNDVAGTPVVDARSSSNILTHGAIDTIVTDDTIEAAITAAAPADSIYETNTATAVAIVLVSHGSNGKNAAASAEETENTNDDQTFVTRPISLDPGDYFDDIVIWRTQTQLYNELGNASCFSPW